MPLFLALLLLVVGPSAFSNSVLTQVSASELEIPVRIQPKFVTATRWLDLSSPLNSEKLRTQPINLFEYPVVSWLQSPHLELKLDTAGHGQVTTLVKIGDFNDFPEMTEAILDLHSAEFNAKSFLSRALSKLGIGTKTSWRFASDRVSLEKLEYGVAEGTFDPGGFLALQKSVPSTQISRVPWLQYEYEIPHGGSWFVQVTVKVKKVGLFGGQAQIMSGPVWGTGHKTITMDLLKLLRESDPDAEDGVLEEINVQYFLARNGQGPRRNIKIDLGKVQLLKGFIPGAPDIVYIPVHQVSGETNVFSILEQYYKSLKNLKLIEFKGEPKKSGRVGSANSLVLKSQYSEKLPEAFLGEKFMTDEISPEELVAVLDQKLFLERRELWTAGKTDVIFRQAGSISTRLLSYDMDIRLLGAPGAAAFLIADYVDELGSAGMLCVTLTGTDAQGRPFARQQKLGRSLPLRLDGFSKLKNVSFALEAPQAGGPPPPASFFLNQVQILEFKKNKVYKPIHQNIEVGLSPIDKTFFGFGPDQVDFNLQESHDIQTIKNFPLQSPGIGDAVIRYNIERIEGTNLDYGLRVRTSEPGKITEKIYPIKRQGEISLKNVHLEGLDLVTKLSGPVAIENLALLVNRLEVSFNKTSSEIGTPEYRTKNEAKPDYIGNHVPLESAQISWLAPAYSSQRARPNYVSIEHVDATLSFEEILSGGREIHLAKQSLAPGDYMLKTTDDSKGVQAEFDQSFLEKRAEQEVFAKRSLVVEPTRTQKVFKLLKVLLFLSVAFLLIKYSGKWQPWVDSQMKRNPLFWGLQTILILAAMIKLLSGIPRGISEAGIILVVVYALFVRYQLRVLLAKKWTMFLERASAPYLGAFLVLIPVCLLALVSGHNPTAEFSAMLGYYLLLVGIFIEFLDFAKNAAKNL